MSSIIHSTFFLFCRFQQERLWIIYPGGRSHSDRCGSPVPQSPQTSFSPTLSLSLSHISALFFCMVDVSCSIVSYRDISCIYNSNMIFSVSVWSHIVWYGGRLPQHGGLRGPFLFCQQEGGGGVVTRECYSKQRCILLFDLLTKKEKKMLQGHFQLPLRWYSSLPRLMWRAWLLEKSVVLESLMHAVWSEYAA